MVINTSYIGQILLETDKLICEGESTTLRATPTGGNGKYSYIWEDGTTTLGTNSKQNVSPSSTTTFYVTLKDDCGTPSIKAEVEVQVLEIDFYPSEAEGCPPLKVEFQDLSNSDSLNSKWNWDFGDGKTSTLQNPVHIYEKTGTYDVTLEIQTAQGCKSIRTIDEFVTIYDSPASIFSLSPSSSTTLNNIVFTNKSTGTTISKWNFGDGAIDTLNRNTQHSYNDTGTYKIQLAVFNDLGCTDTLIHEIYIGPEFIFYVPNAFSPNGDGLNDFFSGQGIGCASYELYVFNMWGRKIWHTSEKNIYHTNLIKNPWNGSTEGGSEKAPNGMYIYLIEITDYFGIEHRYLGHVMLVK